MIRDHNIEFGKVPENLFDNIKIEISDKIVIDDSSKKIIVI